MLIVRCLGGGVMTSGSASSSKIGQWIIVAGLCVQLLFFGTFLVTCMLFHGRIINEPTEKSTRTMKSGRFIWPRDWRGLLFACYTVSVLILIRSVYRLIEFAQGREGYLISHEVFLFVFDATMMFGSMVVMNAFHPSVVLCTENTLNAGERKDSRSEVQLEEQ